MELPHRKSLDSPNPVSRIIGDYDPLLFWPVLTIFLAIVTVGALHPDAMGATLNQIRNFLIFNFSWALLSGVGLTLFFSIYLIFSPYADLKLGRDEDQPEFSFIAWVSMLFSCGLGIGFVFFAVSEPLTHLFQSSHLVDQGISGSFQAIPGAVQMAIFDWGLHAWALFAVGGWAIAFPAYRKGLPLNISTGLYGILGDKCKTSLWGKLADGLGVLGTVGGNAASIGLGVASISFGIFTLFGIELGNLGKAGIMLLIIIAYVCSASSGVERGIKFLSLTNLFLAGCVLFMLLFMGNAPTQYLLNLIIQEFGEYFDGLIRLTFWTDAGNPEQRSWLGWWVIFNWLWWISYVPFCGGFIARISKGRTLREFVLGVLIVPMLLTVIWFSVWGGSAAYTEVTGIVPLWETVQNNFESGIYTLLSTIKGGWWLSLIVLFNMVIFAVTTADSASFFASIQMSRGNQNPKVAMRLLWGLIIGGTGLLFQLLGGFTAIKSLAIVVGFPFFFVSIAFILSVFKMLQAGKAGKL